MILGNQLCEIPGSPVMEWDLEIYKRGFHKVPGWMEVSVHVKHACVRGSVSQENFDALRLHLVIIIV